METSIGFHPQQVVCLEHENYSLFAEVVQLIQPRERCWLRPIALRVQTSCSRFEASQVVDLRAGSDLIWPVPLLRAALDTEFLPLLGTLNDQSASPNHQTKRWLNEFVQKAWQAHPQFFQA
jgi:hypothetical protein